MSRDLIRVPQLRMTLILFALAAALAGCNRHDAISEEKRILSEINQLAEQSSKQTKSDEMRGPLMRLNELRPLFPERRDEIAREAQAVKTVFNGVLKDDEKLAELYQQLLKLPLSDSYRKCVTAQAEIEELTTVQSQKVVDEMDVLLDPATNDRQTLDAKLDTLRSNSDEIVQRLREREMYLDQNCRQPSSNSHEK